jgi:1,4-dihydroxy-2-naphthoyl-CoA hydrolase
MSIWFKVNTAVKDIVSLGDGTMTEHLGLEWMEVGDDYLKAKLPVDHRTIQPYGLLHGGASCVLAETLGSVASHLVIDSTQFYCVGIEINANHIRSARNGYVYGVCSPLHIGSSTHVWDIRIMNEEGKLICVSRLTVAVMKKKDS